MERRQCDGKQQPPPRRGRGERGSFSASLLDAMYRSLDEGGDDGVGAGVVGATRLSSEEEIKAAAPPQLWWAKDAAKAKLASGVGAGRSLRESTAVARLQLSGYASSTTSSSDASSSYSFSCSSASTTDTESMHRRRHSQTPPQKPEEVDAVADSAAPPNRKAKKKKSRPCFPGARRRPRSAVPPPPPPSGSPPPPPATFACIVKAVFSSSRIPWKPKTPTAVPPPGKSPPVPQPPGMSATSSTKASEQRSLRFCPDADTSVARRRVEELVRSLADVDEDEDDDGSDATSDLFELENLLGAGGDELPVYGTTSLAANLAIAQGTVC
ncbi:hypothetical protein GUJ93_ZPchr0009g2242 [Zizania palustris]|uniref:Uncharacterized protein n=1 Tax=Zizania palustris TaxID=103762 RepID=A0A8J5V3D0_ZIZPA|nr:hypothetical protein GUJ93_ZPchr0009g2242 [Zizania palustris]